MSTMMHALLGAVITLLVTATALQKPNTPSGYQPHDGEAYMQRTYFYVGGHYEPGPSGGVNGTLMVGQIYVEKLTPSWHISQKPYPVVFWHGNGQTGTNWLNTPDGRKGWASYFVEHGWTVYIIDQPQRGRSPWELSQGNVTYFTVESIEKMFTATQDYDAWPQAHLHTQWPGTGRQGDPTFDALYASQIQSQANTTLSDMNNRNAGGALLDRIGKAFILTHSQGGQYGWGIGDRRPDLVAGIVALEPEGPPFKNGPIGSTNGARPYGLTIGPLTYDPPVQSASDLIQQTFPPIAENLNECIRQASPARKLTYLSKFPILLVTSESGYHAGYDYCTAAYLEQAGVRTEYANLSAMGIHGNGHFMFMEKNNLEVADVVLDWLNRQCA